MTRKTIVIRHERSDWTDWYVEQLRDEFPEFDFVAAYSLDDAIAAGPRASVMAGIAPQMTSALIAAMPRLEWVQSLTTGIDNLLQMAEMPAGIPITRVVGVQGPQMSEHALTLMLCLARGIPDVLIKQRDRVWDRQPQQVLFGKTVCLLGLGQIADRLASYCKVLGMRVTGISNGRSSAPNVDTVFPRSQIGQAAAEADFFVVLVPLSPETRHIVDAGVLSKMKPTAYLINIARGGCVDEAALHEALVNQRIAGAGIDVFETEPLPSDHPLWRSPNTIVTPHVGGFAEIYHKQGLPIFRQNLQTYAVGGPSALEDAARR